MEFGKEEPFVWVKDKRGIIYSCPESALTDISRASDEGLERCVEEGALGANMPDAFLGTTSVRIKDKAGKEYLCPAHALKNPDNLTDEELRSCFERSGLPL